MTLFETPADARAHHATLTAAQQTKIIYLVEVETTAGEIKHLLAGGTAGYIGRCIAAGQLAGLARAIDHVLVKQPTAADQLEAEYCRLRSDAEAEREANYDRAVYRTAAAKALAAFEAEHAEWIASHRQAADAAFAADNAAALDRMGRLAD